MHVECMQRALQRVLRACSVYRAHAECTVRTYNIVTFNVGARLNGCAWYTRPNPRCCAAAAAAAAGSSTTRRSIAAAAAAIEVGVGVEAAVAVAVGDDGSCRGCRCIVNDLQPLLSSTRIVRRSGPGKPESFAIRVLSLDPSPSMCR